MKIYTKDQIQEVYRQHAYYCNSVLYSIDGEHWQSVPMDSGKWDVNNWQFMFVDIINSGKQLKYVCDVNIRIYKQ